MAIPTEFRFKIGEQAADNYKSNLRNIQVTIDGIDKNRKGEIGLSEITRDQNRLNLRIAREELPYDKAVERINGVSNFQDTIVLQKLERLCKTVCRISILSNGIPEGYGTGFLIGNDLLITNHHVLPDNETASRAVAEFDYELDENNKLKKSSHFKILPDKFFMTSTYERKTGDEFSGLDFTIVAVESQNNNGVQLSNYGFTTLDKSLGKIIEGENCIVIQHPQGNVKKVVLKDIRMLVLADDTMVYESDTLPGSSGSMVIGLGTGELVALHHSGVPKTDERGNWLRKDGSIADSGDPDELIDWIGNEGIRISRLIQAVQKIPLSADMEVIRKQLIQLHESKINGSKISEVNPVIMNKESDEMNQTVQYFELMLSANNQYLSDWNKRSKELIPGLIKSERMFPSSTNPISARAYYLTAKSNKNSWELAREIEALPHVSSCTPDIPFATDLGIEEAEAVSLERNPSAKAMEGLFSRKSSEQKFLDNWKDSVWVKAAINVDPKFFRQWNWLAVNHPLLDKAKPVYDNQVILNLRKLKYIQLDTGYSSHPKIFESYDLNLDLDFISDAGLDDDALDEMDGGILRHPGHGTRTASLSLGLRRDVIVDDGNQGILTDMQSKPLASLIPYRISKTVILISRGKEMADAASHAIRNSTDVMFMCMGSLPRDMFDIVAREAYEQGVIWVCAAGNQVKFVIAPACYPGTIAVAAMNPDDKAWDGSCRGEAVDISAPGEDCYVPGWDKEDNLIMTYGSGTSYATPHIASAAMLWKATNLNELSAKYEYRWQIVEAFRYCLKLSARKNPNLPEDKYGAGVLDLKKLLSLKLPDKDKLIHAYTNKSFPESKDIGEREMAHAIWNNAALNADSSPKEALLLSGGMSKYAKEAMKAHIQTKGKHKSVTESDIVQIKNPLSLLESYFKPY